MKKISGFSEPFSKTKRGRIWRRAGVFLMKNSFAAVILGIVYGSLQLKGKITEIHKNL